MNGKLEMMKLRLAELIEKWLEDEAERDMPCYLGDNTAIIMAGAAMAVLEGMTDMEQYLRNEDLIAEE